MKSEMTAVNMSENVELRVEMERVVAISKANGMSLNELKAKIEEEWKNQNDHLESYDVKEFREKVEKFFEKNESDETWRKFGVDIICAGYELYNQREKISLKAINEKVILSEQITDKNISIVRWTIQNGSGEKIDCNKLKEEINNIQSNYHYRGTKISCFIIWSIAIIKIL